MSSRVFRRPPRRAAPAHPTEPLTLLAPPSLPLPDAAAGWLTALPALSGLGSVAYMFAGPSHPMTYVAGSMVLVSSLAMVGGGLLRGRQSSRTAAERSRRDYTAHLAAVRDLVRSAAEAQRTAAGWTHPDPRRLRTLLHQERLWERRPDDPDFGVIRIGSAPAALCTPLETGPVARFDDVEPASLAAYTRFRATYEVVPDLPVTLDLRDHQVVRVTGPQRRAFVRAALAQTVALHAPTDLRVAVATSAPDRGPWSWVKWLPHAQDPSRVDRIGPVRLLDPSVEALLLGREDGRRPHWLVVLDTGAAQPVLPTEGITLLDLDGFVPRPEVEIEVGAGPAGLVLHPADGAPRRAAADLLSEIDAEALARLMAGLRPPGVSEGGDEAGSLPRLLGVDDPGSVDLAALRAARPRQDRLRVPIGTSPAGQPVVLDLKEAVDQGMGPHGLVVGATGSGKSELLRSLVLGLCTTHDSETLNLVLVDFKGGATFAGLADLPHVSALITNLQDELPLVERMREALTGEMVRRQQLLRTVGQVASVREWDAARRAGRPLDPLPSLLIVVDEFSELLVQKPEFADLFGQIGRLGRSLGLHLLLASQRLDEGRLRGLEAHLSYRIALRTFSAVESRSVLGVPDAHALPSEPGHGYLMADTTTLTRFRAAYVSGTWGRAGLDAATAGAASEIRAFTAGYQGQPSPPSGPAPEAAGPTLLSALGVQIARHGPPAHRVWLPPLSGSPAVASLPDPGAPMCAVVGEIDRPMVQRRDPLVVDLSAAGGHLGVVGGPRSGKSTLLRSVVTSLALRQRPEELHVYVLDLAGSGLAALGRLPHVGGVVGRQDPDGVRRLVAHVAQVVEDRETAFRTHAVDSVADHRRAVGPLADVVLVVDGVGVLRTEFEDAERILVELAPRALGYGVHLVVSASRWLDIRPGLRDLLASRLELKLTDPLDSEVDRRAAQAVPADHPGRGLTFGKEHFLAAAPDYGDELVDRLATTCSTACAPEVRRLPASVGLGDLPMGHLQPDDGVVIGIEGRRLRPVVLDPRLDTGLVVLGDAASGRTSFLRAVGRQVQTRWAPDEATLVVLDYRRGLADDLEPERVLGRARNAQEAAEVVHGLVVGLTARRPGPDVSAAQIRDRTWWSGRQVYLLVDDYDLVATADNPLLPLLDLLPHMRDVGLHVFVARRAGGAGRALADPFLGRLRELAVPAVVLSASPEEGPLFGVRPQPLPPGRGTYAHRRSGSLAVQLVRAEPDKSSTG